MKVTVCELPIGWADSDETWIATAKRIRKEKSDLLLLPEMAFGPWLAGRHSPEPDRWQAAVAAHDRRIDQLAAFDTPLIVGSRPVTVDHRRHNVGFVWGEASGYQEIHTKYYLPDEPGFWEASWYQRGDGRFDIAVVEGIKIGFLICTELWFNRHARDYAAQGIHLLVCPRATPGVSIEKWIAGGQTATVVSGAFCLSSNFNGPNVDRLPFGGTGWIIEPEDGHVLGRTTPDAPFLTFDIDLSDADRAKQTYPRYVPD